MAYALGITELDPLEYNLLFERFLNPERVSLPDIDIDFCMDRRDEVIGYVTQKYGTENVSQIITFGSMLAKGVLRDVGRALDMPYSEVDRIAKLVPNRLNIIAGRGHRGRAAPARDANARSPCRASSTRARRLEGLSRQPPLSRRGGDFPRTPAQRRAAPKGQKAKL